jgi:hypothetical protein
LPPFLPFSCFNVTLTEKPLVVETMTLIFRPEPDSTG